MLRLPSRCPCGTRQPYADCCGALHRGRGTGEPTALTAEALMRSRFSAFAVGDAAYLLASWHSATRPASLQLDDALEWRRLEILGVTAGLTADDRGTVDFVATYWDAVQGVLGQLQEHSSFQREAGQWSYIGPLD